MSDLTHFDESGAARMVDTSGKGETLREAKASALVRMSPATLARIKEGVERRAATLAAAGIDALNLHHTDWNGGLVALVHRFGIAAFAWDLQHEHQLRPALRMGMDAVYSDHVDLMIDVYRDELGAP